MRLRDSMRRASAERILRAMDAQIRERTFSNGCRSMRTSAAADP